MADHPSVARVVSALRAAGIKGEPRWFDDGVGTAAEAAAALGVPVGAIANSLVFTLDGSPILMMTSGAHRVDTAWLGTQLGGTIKRADASLVQAASRPRTATAARDEEKTALRERTNECTEGTRCTGPEPAASPTEARNRCRHTFDDSI